MIIQKLKSGLKQLSWLSFGKMLVAVPFMLCVAFLLLLGKITRLTYIEISVVFNLWIQGGLVVLSSILPFLACLYCVSQNCSVILCLELLFFLTYGIVFFWIFFMIFKHYGTNMNNAFDLCVDDLEVIGHKWGMSYYLVNLIIFILFFLIIIGVNLLMAYHILVVNHCL